MKTVTTLYLLFSSDPLISVKKLVVEDLKVSTELHCPGFVVSLSLLLPFLFLHGLLVVLLFAHVGQKGTSVINLLGNLPCNAINLILERTNDLVSDAIAIIPFFGCHLFADATILLLPLLALQS